MTFAEKLQQLRKQKNLSQEALAEYLDISRQAISRWESGAVMPELDKLIRLSEVFAVTLDYLVKDDAVLNTTPKPEQPKTEPKPLFSNRNSFFQTWIKLMVIAVSFTGIFIIWLLSILKPVLYRTSIGQSSGIRSYSGWMGFLLAHQLNGLVLVLFIVFIGTIGLLIVQYYRRNKGKMHTGLFLVYLCIVGVIIIGIASLAIPDFWTFTQILQSDANNVSLVRIWNPVMTIFVLFLYIGIAGLIVSGIRVLVKRLKRAKL